MQLTRFALIGAALSLLFLSGCATITQGGSQAVTIATDPEGASCNVTRRGETLGVISPSPGQINISKGFAPLQVTCQKVGFAEERAEFASSMQGMTFGNLLIGGGIGFAIDAMSGAMRQYASVLRLTLLPERFDSVTARDAYFEQRKKNLEADVAQRVEAARKNCVSDSCEREVAALEASKREDLEALDERRQKIAVR
jgi:hypothetical protein